MLINFTKMHGLGNDFVVIDGTRNALSLDSGQIRLIADRHFGVGCDQVLLVEAAHSPAVDFAYRIFNADGGEVEQCGNGVRCFARFVVDTGLTGKSELAVQTLSGIVRPRLQVDGQVSVDMGVPRTQPHHIPFIVKHEAPGYIVRVGDDDIELAVVSMGNPHAVLRVDDIDQAPVARLGSLLQTHAQFPARVNVGFMQIVDRTHIRLRVFERGSGETLACGTGACAAVVAGRNQGWLDETVTVDLPGGKLLVSWHGEGQPVQMTGPATRVFEGNIEV